MKILVTGAAGFVGMHLSRRLLERGDEVIGIDNLNDYYDVGLKRARIEELSPFSNFRFLELDIAENDAVGELFNSEKFQRVVHLAAQAGVRYSLINPHSYVNSNIAGFLNILEGCRKTDVEHLVYASSSSVYGGNTKVPFSERDPVDHPVSLYAATKKSNELMAHSYSHLFGIPTTGLRMFTVYGPWGRPDMSYFIFTRAILDGSPIDVYNHGRMWRDFTYVGDVVEGMVRILDQKAQSDPSFDPANPDSATSSAPYRILNIGGSQSVQLTDFIECLEQALGLTAKKNLLPMQPGDVVTTCADSRALENAIGFIPRTELRVGLERFVAWYKAFMKR
jgi:UDP-glucuronate 4-epimerase